MHKITINESPVDKITWVNYHNKSIKNKENIFSYPITHPTTHAFIHTDYTNVPKAYFLCSFRIFFFVIFIILIPFPYTFFNPKCNRIRRPPNGNIIIVIRVQLSVLHPWFFQINVSSETTKKKYTHRRKPTKKCKWKKFHRMIPHRGGMVTCWTHQQISVSSTEIHSHK